MATRRRIAEAPPLDTTPVTMVRGEYEGEFPRYMVPFKTELGWEEATADEVTPDDDTAAEGDAVDDQADETTPDDDEAADNAGPDAEKEAGTRTRGRARTKKAADAEPADTAKEN